MRSCSFRASSSGTTEARSLRQQLLQQQLESSSVESPTAALFSRLGGSTILLAVFGAGQSWNPLHICSGAVKLIPIAQKCCNTYPSSSSKEGNIITRRQRPHHQNLAHSLHAGKDLIIKTLRTHYTQAKTSLSKPCALITRRQRPHHQNLAHSLHAGKDLIIKTMRTHYTQAKTSSSKPCALIYTQAETSSSKFCALITRRHGYLHQNLAHSLHTGKDLITCPDSPADYLVSEPLTSRNPFANSTHEQQQPQSPQPQQLDFLGGHTHADLRLVCTTAPQAKRVKR